MNTIDNYNFKNKRALIRVDFNVPLDEKYNITDVTRINAAIPSINKIRSDGGAVILMSHLGRPKSGYEERYSLKHLVPYLSDVLNTAVKFADDCIGDEAKNISHKLKSGEVLLLENLRFYKEEKQGDIDFAKKLSLLGDVYVNDAFGTAHRAHASTSVIAGFFPNNKMFGYLINKELNNINKVLKYAKHPFTAILGGAKISGKILVIEQLMNRADNIIIGGGMAYTFIKALGGNIGNSMVEEDKIDLSKDIMKHAKEKNVIIYLPTDSIVADSFSNDANVKICPIDKIEQGWMGLDIAQDSCNKFSKVIEKSKTILWNGPMGVFEMSEFENGTKFIAKAVADATKKGAYSLIGGGDSAAAINKYNMADKVSYISTGGGALLEYIEGKELPGIKAVLD